MLTLGIDPGTAITGYGLVREEGGRLELVECGVIRTPADESLPRRLHTLYLALTHLIDTHHPADSAVEELFFARNARTALAVGQARGVVLLALTAAGLPVYEYTPLQVKQAITSYGRAPKSQVQGMVKVLLGLNAVPEPDDAADALAVAICHLQTIAVRQKLGT